MEISIVTIIIIVVVVTIFIKTGSLSKAIGFLFKYVFYPFIFTLLGLLVGLVVDKKELGALIGLIIGIILIIKDAKGKIQ